MNGGQIGAPASVGRKALLPALALLVAAAVYASLWPIEAPDLPRYLYPWLDHIRAAGPRRAFAEPFSNNTPAYLYLLALAAPLVGWISAMTAIKALSIGGTLWLAAAMRRLLLAARADEPGRTALFVPLVPSVALNAALLGQCDALWSAPCLLAVAAAVEGRAAWTLAWWGLAFAIKVQAIFLGPFVAAFVIGGRVPIRRWAIPAAIYALVMVPAWLEGWPALDLATIYLHQTGNFEFISMNAPNLWHLVQQVPGSARLNLTPAAIALAGAAGIAFIFFLRRAGRERLLEAALLSALIVPGLLPRLHDRYFFLADMLAFALAAQRRDTGGRSFFLAVQMGSLGALAGYCTGIVAFVTLGAVAMIAATVALAASFAPRSNAPRAAAAA